MSNYFSSSLLLDPGYRVTLAPEVVIRGNTALDTFTCIEIALNSTGNAVLNRLSEGDTLANISNRLATVFSADPDRVLRDVYDLVNVLDEEYLLTIDKQFPKRPSVSYLIASLSMLFLVSRRAPGRRYRPTFVSLVRACLRAFKLFLLLCLALSVFLCSYVFFSSTTDFYGVPAFALFGAAPLALSFVIVTQLIAHEATHLFLIRKFKSEKPYIYVRGARVGVAYARARLSPSQRWLVAIAGPSSAITTGALMTIALSALHLPSVVVWAPVFLSLVHIVSLVPWAPDGRVLISSLSHRLHYGGPDE